ncbi:MAG: type I methionyl aminopeptidase [Candidatus Woykebacteria bacterium RBG_16_43_9]|uniref:Methionine aminopeptidase n=1 Tax=Candidatus Woykebacteria bacterium RBG_16_43_9 TaxID=1802596 RepID=A0A1G1WH49_9BACT|nr:MAG: type I methionyl aminopeptidase [Candidatus Woykebacteria bacterium RBG_16_43_9]
MIYLKTKDEIKIMHEAGKIAAAAMAEVAKNIRPGVKTSTLDQIVESKIRSLGAESSFKKVKGYKHSICTTPNNWVVHGLPGDYTLAQGDILGVDLGAYYKGFHSDMAHTFAVGKISKEAKKFLSTGETALNKAIKKVKVGGRVGDISNIIQNIVEGAGYSVVRELVGHGVGRDLHEDPLVPGVGKDGGGEEIKEGMVLAVEIIYNRGLYQVQLLSDGWSISTRDGLISGLFERTVAPTKKGPLVLTLMPA